jgi:hypothetical protein
VVTAKQATTIIVWTENSNILSLRKEATALVGVGAVDDDDDAVVGVGAANSLSEVGATAQSLMAMAGGMLMKSWLIN